MTDELKAIIEDAIFNCTHREGISTSVCTIDGTDCIEDVNGGKCPTLAKLFGGDENATGSDGVE